MERMKRWREIEATMRHELGADGQVHLRHCERPTGIAGMLRSAAAVRPDAEALVVNELRLCWRELEERVSALAGGLAAGGLKRGDRIGLFMGNRADFVLIALAAAWLGCPIVPISEREAQAGVAGLLRDSGAAALFFEPQTANEIPPVTHMLHICFDVEGDEFRSLLSADPVACVAEQEGDLAAIVYTSGTTGTPKGAMLSHGGIVHSAMNYARTMDLGAEDRSLAAVPLSHVTGLVAIVATALYAQATTIVTRRFDAQSCLATMARERITHTVLVPAMYNLCLLRADFGSLDLSRWRIGGYGGAPMADVTIHRLFEYLPGLKLMNLYGATETTSPAVIMPPVHALARSNAVGIAAPGTEILVMDEFGRELPAGEPGELWIRGASVVRGYWKNPDATAQEFIAGFWKSGDLGSISPDGFVSVHDRNKDMINRGGYKIYSAEVEAALADFPGVIESAVIARPCRVLGERVHAVVVHEHGATPAEAELAAYLAAKVASYKVPETWEIGTNPLPRNANGKILKRALRSKLPAYEVIQPN